MQGPKAFMLFPRPEPGRQGFMFPVEGRRWHLVAVGGAGALLATGRLIQPLIRAVEDSALAAFTPSQLHLLE
jgi:hypothetical protein